MAERTSNVDFTKRIPDGGLPEKNTFSRTRKVSFPQRTRKVVFVKRIPDGSLPGKNTVCRTGKALFSERPTKMILPKKSDGVLPRKNTFWRSRTSWRSYRKEDFPDSFIRKKSFCRNFL